jgi:hypothetical protein
VVHGSNAHLIDEAAEAAGDGTNEMMAGESSEIDTGKNIENNYKI